MQMGRYAAKVVKARLAGKTPPGPFHYVDKGNLATIGRMKAVGEIRGVQLTGPDRLARLALHPPLLPDRAPEPGHRLHPLDGQLHHPRPRRAAHHRRGAARSERGGRRPARGGARRAGAGRAGGGVGRGARRAARLLPRRRPPPRRGAAPLGPRGRRGAGRLPARPRGRPRRPRRSSPRGCAPPAGRAGEWRAETGLDQRRPHRRWPATGAPEGTVVGADRQSAGRGRRGRSWLAASGHALLVSVLLRPRRRRRSRRGCCPSSSPWARPRPSARTPASSGPTTSSSTAARRPGSSARCRPTRSGWAGPSPGIGVNVRSAPALDDARWSPGALADLGPPPARADLLVGLLDALGRRYAQWVGEGPGPVLEAFAARDALAGRRDRGEPARGRGRRHLRRPRRPRAPAPAHRGRRAAPVGRRGRPGRSLRRALSQVSSVVVRGVAAGVVAVALARPPGWPRTSRSSTRLPSCRLAGADVCAQVAMGAPRVGRRGPGHRCRPTEPAQPWQAARVSDARPGDQRPLPHRPRALATRSGRCATACGASATRRSARSSTATGSGPSSRSPLLPKLAELGVCGGTHTGPRPARA